MQRQGIKLAIASIAVGTLVLAGCGGDSKADFKKRLEKSGMSSEQAECITNGLTDAGVDLNQYDEPSAEDMGKITEVSTDCVMQDLDLPDVSTP